jgi:ABC-type transport system substrate-binding protein
MNKKRILAWNVFFWVFFLANLSSPSAANVSVFILDLPELEIEMMSLEWDDPSPLSVDYLKETLAQIGIKIVHKPLDDTVMYPLIYSGGRYSEPLPNGIEINNTRLFYTYEMSDSIGPTPQHLYWELHSSQDYPWGSNHCFFKDARMDTALDDMNAATNSLELQSALNEIQEIMADQAPLIPLFLSSDSHIINKKWIDFCNMSGGLFTVNNKWTMMNMRATDGDNKFHMAYPGSGISHLNVFLYVDARSNWAAMLHHDSLLALDADYKLIPWVAESFTKSANAMQVNFTLRSGVKFHDGTDVTPDDVKHSIEYQMDATESPAYSSVEKVDNVNIDGNIIVVNFIEPYSFGEYDIGTGVWILPEAFWAGQDYDDPTFDLVANTADKIGCGPYKYVKGVEDQSWTFEKFDDYWYTGGAAMPHYTVGVPLPAGDYPRIENVTIFVGGGSDSRLLGMQNDLYDTERYESYAIDILDEIKAGTNIDYANLKVAEYPSEWLYKITFNTAIKPLDDVNVRRAIAYAINRYACIEYARGGYGYPTYSWVPEVYYPHWYNPNIEKYPYNIVKAKQILEDAGYIDVDGDGVRECPGHYTLPTTLPTTSTPLEMTVPSHPLNLQVQVGDNQVNLEWLVPNDDGGSPINSYYVYRGLESGGPYSYIGNTNSLNFVDNEVFNGKTYYYVVAAVNNIGVSDYSNEAVATPSSITSTSSLSTTIIATSTTPRFQISEIPVITPSWNIYVLFLSLLAILPLRRLLRKSMK